MNDTQRDRSLRHDHLAQGAKNHARCSLLNELRTLTNQQVEDFKSKEADEWHRRKQETLLWTSKYGAMGAASVITGLPALLLFLGAIETGNILMLPIAIIVGFVSYKCNDECQIHRSIMKRCLENRETADMVLYERDIKPKF